MAVVASMPGGIRSARERRMRDLLARTAELAAEHLEAIGDRHAGPIAGSTSCAPRSAGRCPRRACRPEQVVEELARGARPGSSPRPVRATSASSPAARCPRRWPPTGSPRRGTRTRSARSPRLPLGGRGGRVRLAARRAPPPGECSVGITTGAQMANVPGSPPPATRCGPRGLGRGGAGVEGRAAAEGVRRRGGARDAVARAAAARDRRGAVEVVPADDQGAMRADALRGLDATAQRSCARRRATSTAARSTRSRRSRAAAREHGAWVHVDGAFGLWAAASPALAAPPDGAELATRGRPTATSGSTSPTTAALAIRDREAHAAAMGMSAAYLVRREPRPNSDWAPEASRRGRGFAVYAALRSLGRAASPRSWSATARCRPARLARRGRGRGAQRGRAQPGLLGVGGRDPRAPAEGTFWAGGTVWHGRPALRFSVSNWSTTEADIDRSADAILSAVDRASAGVSVATTACGFVGELPGGDPDHSLAGDVVVDPGGDLARTNGALSGRPSCRFRL